MFSLQRAGPGLEATHAHAVRGITLKTETVSVEEWIELLSRRLAEHAHSSAAARSALDSLLH